MIYFDIKWISLSSVRNDIHMANIPHTGGYDFDLYKTNEYTYIRLKNSIVDQILNTGTLLYNSYEEILYTGDVHINTKYHLPIYDIPIAIISPIYIGFKFEDDLYDFDCFFNFYPEAINKIVSYKLCKLLGVPHNEHMDSMDETYIEYNDKTKRLEQWTKDDIMKESDKIIHTLVYK